MTDLKLDATDIRILSAVQEHGRLSKSALSEKVNLSATPTWTRLCRLEKAGLIKGYHADIALALIGDVTTVIVKVSLASHRREDFKKFENRILAIDEIVECVATGGGFDYILKFVATDLAAFQELIEGLLAEEIGIERYFIYVVTREIKSSRPDLMRHFRKSGI